MPATASKAVLKTTPVVREWVPEGDLDVIDGERKNWDGVRTRLPISRAGLMRDHVLVKPGDKILFQASPDPDEPGRWLGPEGEHVEELFRLGMIAGSKPSKMRTKRMNKVELDRNVDGDDENPVGFPELGERTFATLSKEWQRILAGGSEEVIRREHQEARREQEIMIKLQTDGGRIETLVARQQPIAAAWPGAEGPGTGPI